MDSYSSTLWHIFMKFTSYNWELLVSGSGNRYRGYVPCSRASVWAWGGGWDEGRTSKSWHMYRQVFLSCHNVHALLQQCFMGCLKWLVIVSA